MKSDLSASWSKYLMEKASKCNINMYSRFFKMKDVVELDVIRFKELRAYMMWLLICEVDDLIIFFSDSNGIQKLDRGYMCSILAIKRYEELQNMIWNERSNRVKKYQEIKDEVF